MTVYTTGTRPNELWPGIKGFWDGMSKELPPLYTQYMTVVDSDKKYEKYSEHYNTGLAQVKAEGDSTKFAGFAQGASPEFRNVAYSLGIILTHESIADNQYFSEGKDKVRALRKSFYTTKEVNCADVLNNGFDTNFTMPNGDGLPLFSTSHVDSSGTYSNKLAVDADLSETSLEELLIQIKGAFDSTGVHKANLRGQKLIVADANWFEAERILKSILQNDTGNNAVNAIKSTGALPQGYLCNTYLTDSDAWFVTTDVEKGLVFQNREALELYDDNDTDTRNMKYYGYERYATGWVDPRGIYGSAGA
jgi:hypothetical protein